MVVDVKIHLFICYLPNFYFYNNEIKVRPYNWIDLKVHSNSYLTYNVYVRSHTIQFCKLEFLLHINTVYHFLMFFYIQRRVANDNNTPVNNQVLIRNFIVCIVFIVLVVLTGTNIPRIRRSNGKHAPIVVVLNDDVRDFVHRIVSYILYVCH